MRTLVALTAAALVAVNSMAATAMTGYATFGGIAWGSTHAQVRAAFAVKHYVFDGRSSVGSDRFLGRLDDTKTDILAQYDDTDKLAKIIVNIQTADEDARGEFSRIRDQMIEKYGTPDSDFHFFSSPYYEGDGYELSAIKLGKATFSTYWGQQSTLSVALTKQLTVRIAYEGPTWSAYVDRHRANATNDL